VKKQEEVGRLENGINRSAKKDKNQWFNIPLLIR